METALSRCARSIGFRQPAPALSPQHNRILQALDEPTYQRFLSRLQCVSLGKKEVLFEAGSRKRAVYFPINAVIATQSHLAEGLVVDVGITGHQGMLLTGGCCGAVSTDSAVVRVAGSAYRLATQEFLELLRDDEDGMMKFLSLAEIRQQKMAKNLACSHHHSVQQRVAKLLLQLMDLIGDNRIALTHQEMADSLGTRREAVSNMLKKLEQAGILHILRGAVDVQDRSLLMDHACACYEELLAITP